MVVWAAGAAQTPKIEDFRLVPKPCIKNPSARGFCIKALAVSSPPTASVPAGPARAADCPSVAQSQWLGRPQS
jgi:hypothetical protein